MLILDGNSTAIERGELLPNGLAKHSLTRVFCAVVRELKANFSAIE